VSSDIKALKVL